MNNWLVVILGFGMVSAHADDWCKYEADRNAQLDAAGVKKLVISAGAGDLEIEGKTDQQQVRVAGRACASSEDLLSHIQLETRREGETVHVKALLPDEQGLLGFKRNAALDLELTVPSSVTVELEDSSGDVELENVRAAQVRDSSGDLEITGIAGDLAVEDNSGDVTIQGVRGNLRLSDSSGDIRANEVDGQIDIDADSSGDIRIMQAGAVRIGTDTSGDIVLRQIARDVRIDSDSSGDINVDEIGGSFTVLADGSGSIHQGKIAGPVQIPRK